MVRVNYVILYHRHHDASDEPCSPIYSVMQILDGQRWLHFYRERSSRDGQYIASGRLCPSLQLRLFSEDDYTNYSSSRTGTRMNFNAEYEMPNYCRLRSRNIRIYRSHIAAASL